MYKCNSQPCMLLWPIVSFFELVCHKHWCKCSSLLLLACGLSLLWQVPEGTAGTVIKVPHPKAKGCLAAFRGQDGTSRTMLHVVLIVLCSESHWTAFMQRLTMSSSCQSPQVLKCTYFYALQDWDGRLGATNLEELSEPSFIKLSFCGLCQIAQLTACFDSWVGSKS